MELLSLAALFGLAATLLTLLPLPQPLLLLVEIVRRQREVEESCRWALLRLSRVRIALALLRRRRWQRRRWSPRRRWLGVRHSADAPRRAVLRVPWPQADVGGSGAPLLPLVLHAYILLELVDVLPPPLVRLSPRVCPLHLLSLFLPSQLSHLLELLDLDLPLPLPELRLEPSVRRHVSFRTVARTGRGRRHAPAHDGLPRSGGKSRGASLRLLPTRRPRRPGLRVALVGGGELRHRGAVAALARPPRPPRPRRRRRRVGPVPSGGGFCLGCPLIVLGEPAHGRIVPAARCRRLGRRRRGLRPRPTSPSDLIGVARAHPRGTGGGDHVAASPVAPGPSSSSKKSKSGFWHQRP